MPCPLCNSHEVECVHEKHDPHYGLRQYYQCAECVLIFLDPQFYLKKEQEQARYDLHQNNPEDRGYVDFLNQLLNPLCERLKQGFKGMDYGCGPGPTVSVLMRERGFTMTDYDPIYVPDTNSLSHTYDFVTCTEAIEHFYNPAKEFKCFDQCLESNGFLGLMTGMYHDVESFKQWWYHSEPTHVCFYHASTFDWISKKMNWTIEYITDRVVIYMKR